MRIVKRTTLFLADPTEDDQRYDWDNYPRIFPPDDATERLILAHRPGNRAAQETGSPAALRDLEYVASALLSEGVGVISLKRGEGGLR